ncbi:MAG: phenylalanine--tRNA ligase beta subunit [Patescibacteria group bacterium]|nr:MAG: phenylalanine--tRNA ligase beta subunit [Patescibacteria group bacterium]
MNILIPHTWLLEHLDTDADPKKIQEYVSLCGPSVERIYDIESDKVYDIEVTTNRVDGMSIRGIAREAAVILQQFGIKAKLKPNNLPQTLRPETEVLPLPKISNDPKLSKRLICVVLKGVQRNPTPEWMAKRLLQTEQNVHDAVIDITNYVTHELGHPCHAFDYDKLMRTGGEINVVEAKAGEKFITLDANEFETVGGEVVFKNGEGDIIDLPSIKGTANTSIDDTTQNVLLLLESIKAEKVRFASMTHAIRTVAAQLMEKNVDPNLAKDVLVRGAQLYQELCNAQIASEIYDDFPGNQPLKPVEVKLETIHEYLGTDAAGKQVLTTQEIISILEQLECTVTSKNQTLIIQPPSFRPDLTIPADIVEEIARIYGYHKLPSVIMDTQIPTEKQKGVNFTLENRIKRFLASIGLQEIYSYSMVSEQIALQTDSLENHLKLQNPLTDDRIYLRKSLIPSLNEILDQNSHISDLSVFEIANVYLPKKNDLPNESLRLSIVSTKPYREVRGILESLLAQFFVTNLQVTQNSDTTGTILVSENDKEIGLGIVTMQSNNRVAIELEFSQLLLILKTHPTYQSIPKTAIVTEDMTFTLPKKIRVGEIMKVMSEVSTLITKVELKDIYNRNYSFAITYHDPKQNIASDDLKPVRKKIVQELEKHQGILVGTV